MSQDSSKVTTDHDTIRRWAEDRDGTPSTVKGTGDGEDAGLLRIDFPGYSGDESLEPIDWDSFFQKFDASGLALIYREREDSGEKSNFNKLVNRETVAERL